MKRLLVLLLAGCLVFTACASKTEVPKEEPEAEREAEQEEEPETEPKTISPLPDTIDVEQMENCTAAVSLEEGDAYVDDTGLMQMKVKVFVYDLYDMVDISLMTPGDSIIISGQKIMAESLETSEYGDILINGGLDKGGFELRTDENGVYYLNGYSDVKTWRELGEATIPVSQDFIYTDASDLDKEPVTWYPGDFLTDDSGIEYNFTPYNTTVVIEEGMVTAMNRVYTP